jgi:hypothetical protein
MVLGVAAIFEAVTWTIAYREFRRAKGPLSWWAAMRTSKDPIPFTVLVEDTAAMFGLAIALLGIALADALGSPRLDAAAARHSEVRLIFLEAQALAASRPLATQ